MDLRSQLEKVAVEQADLKGVQAKAGMGALAVVAAAEEVQLGSFHLAWLGGRS